MKVLLINPPQVFYPGSEQPAGNLPLGLMYIAAMLDKAGYKTEVLDAFMSDDSFLKNGENVNVGMPFERIRQEIYSRKPDIVGIAGPFTCQIENSVKISNLTKQVDSSILTVVGGPHVTTMPKEFLEKSKSVDIAVIGEGEYSMLELAQYFEGKKQLSEILGVAYRKDKEVIVNSPRPLLKT